MKSFRVLVLGCLATCAAFLFACGGSDDESGGGEQTGSASSGVEKPAVGKAVLVRAPAGAPSAVVVQVPIVYDRTPSSRARHRVRVRTNVIVPGEGGEGHAYAGRPDADSTRSFPDRLAAYAHQYLSSAGASAVERALAAGSTVNVRATAGVETDVDADGVTDERGTSESEASVTKLESAAAAVEAEGASGSSSELSGARAARPSSTLVSLGGPPSREAPGMPRSVLVGAGAGGYTGADPCDHFGPLNACQNVRGSTWTATHFWDSNRQRVACPSGFGPPKALSIAGVEIPYHSVDATTEKYTVSAIISDSGDNTNNGTVFLIVNDNISGHHTMTPVTTCTPND